MHPPIKGPLKAYKAMNSDMTCRGFQYEVGKTYEAEGEIELCGNGFHACAFPLACFDYYAPGDGLVFAEVTQHGEIDGDEWDKTVSAKITIDAKLTLPDFIGRAVDWIIARATEGAASEENDRSAATNTGYRSAATNTGYQSAATNTGYRSAATNTGYQSAATNTGDRSAATNTGDRSAATNTGYRSAASVEGKGSLAVATGYDSKAKAPMGSAFVLVERDEDGLIIAVHTGIPGQNGIKADTWYRLDGNKMVEG